MEKVQVTECSGCGQTYVANLVGLPYWEKVGPPSVCLWIPAGGGQGPASDKPWTTHSDLMPDSSGHWVTGIFNGFHTPAWEGQYKSVHTSGCPAGTYAVIPGTAVGTPPSTITLYAE